MGVMFATEVWFSSSRRWIVDVPNVSGLLASTTYKMALVFPGSMYDCHIGAITPPTSRIMTTSEKDASPGFPFLAVEIIRNLRVSLYTANFCIVSIKSKVT